jgi:serine/threonine protein kinase/WD40 repeat protein
MSDHEMRRNPVEELAESFLQRYRRGERPSLSEYIRQYPELEDEIRDVFPALAMMEEVGPDDAGHAVTGGQVCAGAPPARLGEYRILREVGRGGMGIVYEAEQEALGRRVALKVLPLSVAGNATSLQRFRREARSAARLHHTNIVPVFDVGEHQGTHYYAMQFIHGQGLDQVLLEIKRLRADKGTAREKPPPNLTVSLAGGLLTGQFVAGEPIEAEEGAVAARFSGQATEPVAARSGDRAGTGGATTEDAASSGVLHSQSEFSAESDFHYYRSVARVGLQVAEALAYAHGQKVLHRDIKPSNLLLDMQGTVWVTDFGLAKEEGSDLTRTGDVVGTLRYMAPERFNGIADARSDIYSLGLTLYELLALKPAIDETHRDQLLRRISHEELPPLRRWDRHVPRDLDTIILKASAKDPQQRYQTAEALAEDLGRFLADRPILARRASPREQLWRWCRRNPALALAGSIAGAGVLAVTILSTWFALYQGKVNEELRRRQKATEAALFQSRVSEARLAEEHGLERLRQGETNPGLIWLAHALELAPEEAPDLQANLRRQLAQWQDRATPLRLMLAHPDEVAALAFSPDGQAIFTGCADGKARRWDARSGKLLDEPVAFPAAVDSLVPSFDGKALCVLSKQERRFLDAASGQLLAGQRGDFPAWDWVTNPQVRYSANGKTVIKMQPLAARSLPYFSRGTVTTAAAPGKQRTIDIAVIWYYPLVAVNADGTLFVNWSSRGVEVCSAATGAPVGKPLSDSRGPKMAVFRPDGKTLLMSDEYNAVRHWDPLAGQPLCQPLPHPARVSALAYSPDGRQALTACADGTVRLWDLTVPGPSFHDVHIPELKANRRDQPLIVHEGRFITMDSAGRVHVHDQAQTRHLCTLPVQGQLDRLAVAHDGRILATSSRDHADRWGRPARVCFWNVDTGQQIGPTLVHPDTVWTLVFSPDGETLVTNCFDGNVRFWKVGTDTPAGPALSGHPGGMSTLPISFSPDSAQVLTGCLDKARSGSTAWNNCVLWDRATGALLHTFPHPGSIDTVVLSPTGTRILVAGGGLARLWDTATSKPIGSMARPAGTIAAAFSPDGQVALTAGSSMVQLWEASTALPLGPQLPWDRGSVRALAFTPDGLSPLVYDNLGYRLFPMKRPVLGDAHRIALSAQVLTGLDLDPGGAVEVLDAEAWNERRRQLDELGGPLLP